MTSDGRARGRTVLAAAGAAAFFVAAVVALTWPQARLAATHVVSHVDPFFSMWRITWVAHAVASEPDTLFDANIFHPSPRTLAMSDATLLQGLLSMPGLLSGLSPLEWPLPSLDKLPGFDALYAFWSSAHWNPLVNGYSGYYPPEFAQLIVGTMGFPGRGSVSFLRERSVRYIVVHCAFIDDSSLPELLDSMRSHQELEYVGRLEAPSGPAELFRIRP
jgi:hypothetical protein